MTTGVKQLSRNTDMKIKLALCCASLSAALFFSMPAFAGELIISTTPVTTAESDTVGVKFYVRSTYANTVNARAYVTSRNNVTGDVIFGPFTIDNVSSVLYGTFMRTDPNRAWDVTTEVKADDI
jgi:hypothetical protein